MGQAGIDCVGGRRCGRLSATRAGGGPKRHTASVLTSRPTWRTNTSPGCRLTDARSSHRLCTVLSLPLCTAFHCLFSQPPPIVTVFALSLFTAVLQGDHPDYVQTIASPKHYDA